MKKTQIFLLSLALVLLSSVAIFIGCEKQGDFYISVDDPKEEVANIDSKEDVPKEAVTEKKPEEIFEETKESVDFHSSRIGKEVLQYPGKTEEYKYNVFETYVEIEEYVGSATDIIVPSTIEDLPVKVVGGFYLDRKIENVTLPEGIVIISEYAFDNCKNLKTINIPETVIEIGERAFNDCPALESLTIPKSVTKIGHQAFGIGYENKNVFVRFYKGTAAAQYVAESASDLQYEIINLD